MPRTGELQRRSSAVVKTHFGPVQQPIREMTSERTPELDDRIFDSSLTCAEAPEGHGNRWSSVLIARCAHGLSWHLGVEKKECRSYCYWRLDHPSNEPDATVVDLN